MIGTGTVLAGRYRLEQRIATGGMGEVWQGFDSVLGRPVAIKCLRAPSDDREFVDRFRAEARTMATISHPGVVEVYDFGDDPAAGMYLVMKYIDGESLAQTLAREGRLSAPATMRLVAETAAALHAAHEKGVTHRDVKPGNLLLRRDGSVVLTDFGIARSAGATRHTLAGSLLGTAGYIAPERANGEPATPQSDIYSLGIVAYRCLSGQLPFVGDSMVELALRHAHDEPPPLPADVPAAVRAIVERAMAKDPRARWPSAAALAAEARRAIASMRHDTAVAPAPTRRQAALPRRGRPLAGGTAATPEPGTASLAAPTNLTATAIGPNTIRLQWTDNSTDEDGFTVINGIMSHDVGANTTTYDWTGLPPATHVCFKVRSYNSSGTSSYYPAAEADWVCATSLAGSGPAAPTGLMATPTSPTTIRLQWTDNSSDEDGFTVYNGNTTRSVGAGTTSYDWDGLSPGTYMCFKVRSFTSAGVSAYYPADPDWVCTRTPTS